MNAKINFENLTQAQSEPKKTAADHIFNAQCHLEALEGVLLRTVVSYEQCEFSDAGTKALFVINACLAEYAVEDIESAMSLCPPNRLDNSYQKALGVLTAICESAKLDLAKGHTCAILHGLFTVVECLDKELSSITDTL